MGYKKYVSIENHYNSKYINGLLLNMPELEEVEFQITEKIDGSNFQIEITKNSIRYGKRNSWLEESDSFFDYKTIVNQEKVQTMLAKIQDKIVSTDVINLYGEIYGPGIQKRIQYGITKDIRFFEMKLNGHWCTPFNLEHLLIQVDAIDLHAPILGVVKGLTNALKFVSEVPTQLFEINPNNDITDAQEVEGVVIKPYGRVIEYRNAHLIVKKKNKAFSEKMGVKPKDYSPKKFTELQNDFITYLNTNRMASVVSQYGEPQSPKEIGKYLSLLGNDAFNDFAKDQGWDIFTMDKKAKKPYTSLVGAYGAPLVKEYL